MRRCEDVIRLFIIAAVLNLISAGTILTASEPIKVFILAGQSNMQGHAQISTFDSMATDPKTAPILKDMRNADGSPYTCKKVWISSIGCLGDAYSDLTEKKGLLTAGFGAPSDKIGPEFTFGIYMEKMMGGKPILIIKTAWGGRDLNTEFRPPSAGPYVWSDFETGQYKQADELAKKKAEKINNTGVWYRHMIDHVRFVLGDIKRVVPEYDPNQGYELSGFVWFQGFNDVINRTTYHDGYGLYSKLLADLIRDVRKDLSAPKMPFVIGVMGIGGLNTTDGSQLSFRKAMAAPAMLPEFQGNVAAVETAPFWDDDLDALATKEENKATLTSEEQKRLKAGVSNGGYHYLGAAKILAPIGKAFAEAMKKLISERVTALTGPGPYVKLAAIAKQIQAGQNLGGAFKTLNDKKNSADSAEATEATTMLAALSAGAQDQLDDAMRDKENDPASAITKLDIVVKKFAGSVFATQAKETSEAMKKDPKVKKEIQASSLLDKIVALEATLKKIPNANDLKSDAFRRLNATTLQAVVGNCQALVKRYPDTNAARKATEIIDRYR
jgi:Carbohydrate esterase, sialic acid-specific acetylesterase